MPSYLAYCNLCDQLMWDDNPQTGDVDDDEKSIDLDETDYDCSGIPNQKHHDEGHVVCPVCETDENLTDVTERKARGLLRLNSDCKNNTHEDA